MASLSGNGEDLQDDGFKEEAGVTTLVPVNAHTGTSGRRMCQHVNNKGQTCNSFEVADGYCRKHGPRWRCKHLECSKYAVIREMCVAHARQELGNNEVNELRGKALRCKKYPECSLKPALRGFCLPHAREQYGDETVDELRQKSRCCKYPECQKKVVLKGFCTKHAREKFGNEEFDRVHRPLGRCKLETCDKKAFVRGYCTSHAREHVPREEFDKQYKKLRRCKHPGCDKWSVVKGYCITHGNGSKASNDHQARVAAEAMAAAQAVVLVPASPHSPEVSQHLSLPDTVEVAEDGP